jgi:hypothetical protein
MKGLLSRRPSPALVVAVIALFVAMVGTGYAAFKLPKNSVGSKQIKKEAVSGAKIKKDAVTGAKVKDQSLTGSDINLGTLGTVPSANVANTANGLAPLEATHLIGAPGQPGFLGGAGNVPVESGLHFNPAGFYKDHDGVVHLQGVVKAGTSEILFVLPPGFRPAPGTLVPFEQLESALTLIAGSNVFIEGFGDISGAVVAAEEVVVLDGITFRAES